MPNIRLENSILALLTSSQEDLSADQIASRLGEESTQVFSMLKKLRKARRVKIVRIRRKLLMRPSILGKLAFWDDVAYWTTSEGERETSSPPIEF